MAIQLAPHFDEISLEFIAVNGPLRLHDRVVVSTRGAEANLAIRQFSAEIVRRLCCDLCLDSFATFHSNSPSEPANEAQLVWSEAAGIQPKSGTRFVLVAT